MLEMIRKRNILYSKVRSIATPIPNTQNQKNKFLDLTKFYFQVTLHPNFKQMDFEVEWFFLEKTRARQTFQVLKTWKV